MRQGLKRTALSIASRNEGISRPFRSQSTTTLNQTNALKALVVVTSDSRYWARKVMFNFAYVVLTARFAVWCSQFWGNLSGRRSVPTHCVALSALRMQIVCDVKRYDTNVIQHWNCKHNTATKSDQELLMTGCLRQNVQNDTAVPWSIHAIQTFNCELQQKYVSTKTLAI